MVNPNGKFKPLHKFNPIRIDYIKNNIIKDFNISSNHKPLKGISILDIGCGAVYYLNLWRDLEQKLWV